jgi:hydroxymethylpyrimidine pyrophosphatase-like HAD family hydrolase
VTHPAANKGSVVDFLSAVYLIPASCIAAIGDMPNDILMFEQSGMSIAMGNFRNLSDAVWALSADSPNATGRQAGPLQAPVNSRRIRDF